MKKIAIFLFSVIILFSCAPKIVPPPIKEIDDKEKSIAVVEEIKDVPVTVVELPNAFAEGKSLFENNCSNCHKLYNPKDFTAQQWLPIMNRMQKQANLSDVDHDKIYAYLTSN
jgi:nitrate/TMAO reductase-like tetraheme cytochrome c subunit